MSARLWSNWAFNPIKSLKPHLEAAYNWGRDGFAAGKVFLNNAATQGRQYYNRFTALANYGALRRSFGDVYRAGRMVGPYWRHRAAGDAMLARRIAGAAGSRFLSGLTGLAGWAAGSGLSGGERLKAVAARLGPIGALGLGAWGINRLRD